VSDYDRIPNRFKRKDENNNEIGPGTDIYIMGVDLEGLTVEEIYVYIKEQHDIEVQKYCDEIKTVEDLLKFPFKYSFNAEEYTNYDAMEAYKIKAKELLNVNIEL
jgi:hypothetical protein